MIWKVPCGYNTLSLHLSPGWGKQRHGMISARLWGPIKGTMPKVSLNPTQEDGSKPGESKKITVMTVLLQGTQSTYFKETYSRTVAMKACVKGKRDSVRVPFSDVHFQIWKLYIVEKSTLSLQRLDSLLCQNKLAVDRWTWEKWSHGKFIRS